MIIRRIANALRSGQWSNFVIEIIVVVVGIFLGLQVDGWNEARKDSARERVYLERLLGDVDAMIAQHEAFVVRSRPMLEGLFVSFDALRSCALDPDHAERFEDVILNHQGLERLGIIRSTFDEMVASGALARIDDAELKKQISSTYSAAATAQQFIEYFTADLGRASDIIWRHVSFDVRADAAGSIDELGTWESESFSQSVSYDFDELCRSATFRNALVEVFDSQKDRIGVGSNFAAELRILRGLIQSRLQAG